MKLQIFKNLFSNYLGNFLSMALGFLIVPFVIKKLGKEAFGISVLAESIILFLQIFAFSIRIALSRHATFALSQGNQKDFVEYLSTGKYILRIVALVVLVPGILISFFFPQIFNVPFELHTQSRWLAFLIAIALAVSMPNMVYWAVLYAHQRFDLINISNFGGIILRAVFIFVLFAVLPSAWVNLITYGIIYFVMIWGQNHMVYLWHRSIYPGLHLHVRDRNPAKIKEILSFGGYASISGTAAVIYECVMSVVINILMGPVFNALYSVSTKIPSILKRLFLTPGSSLAPSFASYVATKDMRRMKFLFLFYSKMINLIVLPIGLIVAVSSHKIILGWVGKDFLEAARIMPMFLLANIFAIPTSICSGITNAFGDVKIPALLTFFSSLFAVSLGLLLAFKLNLGLDGIAIALLVVNFFVFTVFMPLYCCKKIGILNIEYWAEVLLKPAVLISLTFIPFVYALCSSINSGFKAGFGAVLAVCYCVTVYKLLLNVEERKSSVDLVRSLLKR